MTKLFLLLPNAGDQQQAIKREIMQMTDALVMLIQNKEGVVDSSIGKSPLSKSVVSS